jgi:hypothetical protein
MRTSILIVSMLAGFAACSPYSPNLGNEPFLCDTVDPKCPDGYECQDGGGGRMVCVTAHGTVTDAGTDSNKCADDVMLEPNNDISHATQTPLDSPKKTIPYAGLAICPAGDKDTFAVNISAANENLEATLVYEVGGAVIQLSMLNSGGGPIANGMPTGMNTTHAYVPNLPVGTYYVQAFGPASGTFTTNNYKLTLTVTP